MMRSSQSTKSNRNNDESTKLELLTFTLEEKDSEDGRQTLYGINVFKVKELVTLPRLTRKPNSHDCAPGMANIRGVAIPVVDLQRYYNYNQPGQRNILILTEFSGSSQGFVVNEVKTIIEIDWRDVNQPPDAINDASKQHGNTLTGISILANGEMVMLVDLEKVISDVLGNGLDTIAQAKLEKAPPNLKVLFADDTLVARKQVGNMLENMGIEYSCAKDGQEALAMLDLQAQEAEAAGKPLSDTLNAIITDIEMPIMDGYVLTRKIKEDRRFDGIPVMMHSSLSAEQSKIMGKEVGVDGYLTKLQPKEFSEALNKLMGNPIVAAA